MITLEAIRTAIRSPDPFEEMDSLVRKELGAGQRVIEVFEALNRFVDTVLETPDYPRTEKKPSWGTLDALTGGCHPDWCYKDLPSPALPTDSELAKPN